MLQCQKCYYYRCLYLLLVKKHIDFAIIRCGYGSNLESQDDPYFKRNADECTRLKIPFGVYLYSYATNEREALSEAEHVLRLAKSICFLTSCQSINP